MAIERKKKGLDFDGRGFQFSVDVRRQERRTDLVPEVSQLMSQLACPKILYVQ
jgi:hypothetical protein